MVYLSMLSKSCLYGRSSYCRSNNIKNAVRYYTQVVDEQNMFKPKENIFQRFPDYKTVYTLPHIKYAALMNSLKYRQTIFNAIIVPIAGGLCAADFVSSDTSIILILSGCFITIWLHSIGFIWNNLIGFVYFKEDDQQVILSYVNYWGKRIDLKTTLDNITLSSETNFKLLNKLYRVVRVKSPKQKLKINVDLGEIVELQHFNDMFGDFK